MEKIKFDFVDYYLRKLPVDVNKLIYEYYDNFCCYCENEMSLCFCCEKYFCMIARCGNSLCVCEKMNRYGFYPYGVSVYVCPNKCIEHYENCFYQTFYRYNCNLYCYECYDKKIN